MKTWILRQDWNEKEYDNYLMHVVKLHLDESIDYDTLTKIVEALPNPQTTTYLDCCTNTDYKSFCKAAKLVMRARKAKYSVMTQFSESNELCSNEKVLKYLYATLNIDEV